MSWPKWFFQPRWKTEAFVLLAVFACEFILFDQLGAHHHTWIFPRWNDQIQYLTESYLGYEQAKHIGLGPGLWAALINPSAQGTLHDFWAICVFSIVGPSRSAALSINLAYFIIWQLAVFLLLRSKARVPQMAWVALGLMLCLRSPWNPVPGSAFDFRLDWMTACTFGLALVAAIRTERFGSTGWSIAFGLAVGYSLLTRFLVGTYFLLIYLFFFGWILGSADGRGKRMGRLFLSGIIAAALAGPIMWLNREWVYNYYMIGHFTGPESALRSSHMGIGGSIAWVVTHFSTEHLGSCFLWFAGLVSAAFAYWGFLHRQKNLHWPSDASLSNAALVPAFAFLLSPALILTLHQQKSDPVLSIMLSGLLMLILLFWCNIASTWNPRGVRILISITSLVGAIYFVKQMSAKPVSAAFETDARKVISLSDYIFIHAKMAGLDQPRVGVDRVTDCLGGLVLPVVCYERRHIWVPFIMTIPTGIFKEKESLLMERVTQSDFVFLTEDGDQGSWPFDREMKEMRPQTLAWSREHMKEVEHFQLFGVHMVLFQRREIP